MTSLETALAASPKLSAFLKERKDAGSSDSSKSCLELIK